MTRSHGRASQAWIAQVVHIDNPDVTSAANLVLLARQYFSLDKSIYTDFRMAHYRKKWLKIQMKSPDELGGLTCAICNRKGLLPNAPDINDRVTLDHVLEISKGGVWNDMNNFQVACLKCNYQKNKELQ